MFNFPLASPFELENIPQRLSRITWISTSIICLWIFFYPRPYYLSVGIAIAFMPVLAIVALRLPNGRNKGKEGSLYNRWNDIRFFILGPMLVLSTILSLRISLDNQSNGSLDFYLYLTILSFVLSIILYLIFQKGIGICLLVSSLFSVGMVIFFNGYMLNKAKTIHYGILVKKYGSIKPVQYHFHINSDSQQVHIEVNNSTYSKNALGSEVCYSKQNGRFGVEIFEPIECPVKKYH